MSETVLDADASPESPLHGSVPADDLRTALEPVAALVEECRVEFDEDGLRVAATDPATVALVDVRIGAAAFDTYGAGSGRIGLDLERFLSVLGVGDRDADVRFELDPETRRLAVDVADLSYSLALLDPDTVREPPEPAEMDYELPGSATVTASALDRGVDAAATVGDHVAVGMDADEPALVVHADGDTDEASLQIGSDDAEALTAADVESLYSVDYLESMCRAIPSGTTVDVDLGSEAPLSLSVDPTAAVSVDYLLAPRRRADYGE